MTAYEALLAEYDYLAIEEAKLKTHGGLYSSGYIWIQKDQLEKRKACLLAEEVGHYQTSCGNILNPKTITNQKQEYKARVWAFKKLLPYEKIVSALKYGCRTIYDLSEYFSLDEEFIKDCLHYYNFI
jgi:hypothetical protein